MSTSMEKFMMIRNIAIIAHVDHGKTSLVDAFLRQSGTSSGETETELDFNDLERERGITIVSKCTSISYKGYTINILDTPGHTDFGAEVERVLKMADGCILVVDSTEGMMPQSKFVIQKAAENNLKIIVLMNKIDKPTSDPENVQYEVLDAISKFKADYIDAPVYFGSGRAGYVAKTYEDAKNSKDIFDLLDGIIEHIPYPKPISEKLVFLTSMVMMDKYFGKLLVGRIYGGQIKVGDSVKVIDQNKKVHENFRINKLFTFVNISKVEVNQAEVGEIIAISGSKVGTINHIISHSSDEEPLIISAPKIDPPTISVCISVNNSPLAGKDGNKLTSAMIQERLKEEAASNVGITLEIQNDSCIVSGRGELQISVLAEQMRREGFEFLISRPKIIYKYEDGIKKEPIEEVTISIPSEPAQYQGIVLTEMKLRGATPTSDSYNYNEKTEMITLKFYISTRGLIGYYGKFLSQTRGEGLLNKAFYEYQEVSSKMIGREEGVLISMASGMISSYALFSLKDRGTFFVKSGMETYPGMVIGVHNRNSDLAVNAVKSKELTNVRASGKDEAIVLPPPIIMDIQRAIEFIDETEIVEVTPNFVRIKKISFKS
jgi:GTP-binding protein